jgi:hypothetical protein
MQFWLIRKEIQHGDMHIEIIFEGQKKDIMQEQHLQMVVRKGCIMERING